MAFNPPVAPNPPAAFKPPLQSLIIVVTFNSHNYELHFLILLPSA